MLDPKRYRHVMGAFATGVAVVTTEMDGNLFGMTVNSLTSVSLDPCLLLICVRTGSQTGRAIIERGAFIVNLLSSEQLGLARRFATQAERRFDDLEPGMPEGTLPRLPGSLAFLSCEVDQTIACGDHEIIIGKVVSCDCHEREPLLFYRGSFGRHQTLAAA